jgi:hypothetical protein
MATPKAGVGFAGGGLTAISSLYSARRGAQYHRVVTLDRYLAVCIRGFHMTSLPQTQQRTFVIQDSRRRTPPAVPAPGAAGASRNRLRQALPAIDPSKEFGCVDWFLYPDTAAAEPQARASA